MIDSGWDEYRGWASAAAALQKDLSWANTAALACAALAAALGALAAALGKNGGKPLAALAAVAAAATPIVGRHILESGSQAGSIRARATAEAIKGECYRAAARLPPYDGPDARNRFYAMLDALWPTRKVGSPSCNIRLVMPTTSADRRSKWTSAGPASTGSAVRDFRLPPGKTRTSVRSSTKARHICARAARRRARRPCQYPSGYDLCTMDRSRVHDRRPPRRLWRDGDASFLPPPMAQWRSPSGGSSNASTLPTLTWPLS